jgi:hypothetical protein
LEQNEMIGEPHDRPVVLARYVILDAPAHDPCSDVKSKVEQWTARNDVGHFDYEGRQNLKLVRKNGGH